MQPTRVDFQSLLSAVFPDVLTAIAWSCRRLN